MTVPQFPDIEMFDANRGVRLFYRTEGDLVRVMAQALEHGGDDDRRLEPVVVPSLIDRCAGLARAMRRTSQTQMLITLYLGMLDRRWIELVPQQTCYRDAIHCRLTSAGWPFIEPNYRLAGTFRSVVFEDVDLEAEVPAADGVHFLFDLEAEWIRLAAYQRIGGRLSTEWAERLIYNEGMDQLPRFFSQLHVSAGPKKA